MTSGNGQIHNEILDRFKQHSGLPEDHFELLRYSIVRHEFLIRRIHFVPRPPSRPLEIDDGSIDKDRIDLDAKYLQSDGSEFTLADVPLKSLVAAIENHIQVYVAEHRRTEVYEMIVEGVRGIKQTPKWGRQVDNLRAKPRTPFSESRDPPESRKTNKVLFESFASASKLGPETLARIRGMIVWCDSERSNGTWGAIKWDTFTVTGGRLGPAEEHTLYDAPNCYVRDRLMASTSLDIEPERRDRVRRIVFSDLTSSQIKQYATAIEEIEIQMAEDKLEKTKKRPAKTKKSQRPRKASDRALMVRRVQLSRKIAPQEAECIMKQEEILDAVDDTICLAPSPSFAARKTRFEHPYHFGREYSVLTPGALVQKDAEISIPSCDVDRDCDQLRAMIKIFVRKGHWTMDEFIQALHGPRRRQISDFLEKRGPLQGKQSSVFVRIWIFFKRRELLGYELTAPPPRPSGLTREVRELVKLREVDPNRGKKRPSLETSGGPGKLQKASYY
ncbi:hypothetical protein ANO14919_022230 [Xylariales sp. No.14919]|nr:hypothetical protein ANO14919_022230 [Xylariales sp. No.14919]